MDDCKSDLKAAIDKWKEHQEKLSEVLRSIKEVETDIVKRWEDCDLRITQLDSFSDNIGKTGQPESFEAIKGKVDSTLTFLNEESDVIDQSSVDETILNRIVILRPESGGQEMTAVSIMDFDENDPKYFQKTLMVHLLASILEPRETAPEVVEGLQQRIQLGLNEVGELNQIKNPNAIAEKLPPAITSFTRDQILSKNCSLSYSK